MGFLWLTVKNLPTMQETQVQSMGWENPWVGRTPGEGNGNTLQYSCLPEEFYEQRSLVGYSPWGLQRVGHD